MHHVRLFSLKRSSFEYIAASCTITPTRQKPINILRTRSGDHQPAYSRIQATHASMAKLRAKASIHSITASASRRKRTTVMPGQTKRNHITRAGRTTVPGNTKVTRPTAVAESTMIAGQNHDNHDTRITDLSSCAPATHVVVCLK